MGALFQNFHRTTWLQLQHLVPQAPHPCLGSEALQVFSPQIDQGLTLAFEFSNCYSKLPIGASRTSPLPTEQEPFMQGSSHGEFSLPSGPNMHTSASSSQRKPSWQSQRISSIRSGRPGHAPSSRHSTSSAHQRDSARGKPQRRASIAASAQSSQPEWWRVRLFRGMMKDVKRRAPYYWSDWTDAWDYRIVPATVYMYFAKYVLLMVLLSCIYSPS